MADELIATAINAGSSEDFADDAAGGLIAAIGAGYSTDCANIMISYDAVDVSIAAAINADDSTDCADDAAFRLIPAIYAGDSTDCANILILDYAADEIDRCRYWRFKRSATISMFRMMLSMD